MLNISHNFARLLIIIVCLFTTSCVKQISKHGHIPTTKQIDEIRIGKTNKIVAKSLLGAPSFSLETDNITNWYYLAQEKQRWGFMKDKIIASKILKIEIKNNTVTALYDYDLSDYQQIAFTEEVTKTDKVDLNIFEQILENAGRFGNSPDF